VTPRFRGAGFAKSLLDVAISESIFWNCKYVWSYPREESLGVYESMGFKKQGDFKVADYGFNCIAVKEN
jgi:L-amino acid N-acyltransferase YncA